MLIDQRPARDAQQGGDGSTVGLPARGLHHGADEGAERSILAGGELLPRPAVGTDRLVDEAFQRRRVHRLEPTCRSDRRGVAAVVGDELGEHRFGLRGRQRPVDLEAGEGREIAGRHSRLAALVGEGLLDVDERPGCVTAGCGDSEDVVVLAAFDDDHDRLARRRCTGGG